MNLLSVLILIYRCHTSTWKDVQKPASFPHYSLWGAQSEVTMIIGDEMAISTLKYLSQKSNFTSQMTEYQHQTLGIGQSGAYWSVRLASQRSLDLVRDCLKHERWRAGQMAQQIRAFVTKSNELSLIPGSYMVGGN